MTSFSCSPTVTEQSSDGGAEGSEVAGDLGGTVRSIAGEAGAEDADFRVGWRSGEEDLAAVRLTSSS